MTRILSIFAVLVLSVLIYCIDNAGQREAEAKQMGPGDYSLTLKVGELERRYLVHVPPQYDGKTPMPVVVMLHGGGGTGKAAPQPTTLERRLGAVLCGSEQGG
jgi:polyhydroxybutyrate depolymerase